MGKKETEKNIKNEPEKNDNKFSFFGSIKIILSLIFIFFSLFLMYGLADFISVVNNETKETEVIDKAKKTETNQIYQETKDYYPVTSQEEAVVSVVENFSPAVVSIIVTKDLPVIERRLYSPDLFFRDPFMFQDPFQYEERGTERREIGGGTGFFISSDGLVLTNRHVVQEQNAEYTILTNNGEKFEAEVIGRDLSQDLAVMRIKDGGDFPTVVLGDSSNIKIGQTVIAIGNSLGEFRNTVSVGVVSGLGRSVSATDGRMVEVLENVIQTDAAINMGNSGGPLLNLRGEVIGINTAMAVGAQNIGFSIPINNAIKTIESVIEHGEIVYPFLGIRYLIVDDELQKENNLSVNYGAWIVGERGQLSVEPDSAADKAGLREGDIILAFDGEKIDKNNHLANIILRYNPGDEVELKISRRGQELKINVVLGKRSF